MSHLPVQFSPRQELLFLLMLAGLQFTHILDFMIVMPLSPHLMQVLHMSNQEFAVLVSVYGFAAGIAGFLGGLFIDRFERKRALLCLYAGFTVATLCCALSNSYMALLISRALAGAFGGVLSGVIYTMVGDFIPNERRGRATGTIMTAFSVSAIAGVPLGLYLADTFGHWQAPFLCLSGLSAALLGVAWLRLPDAKQHLNALPIRPWQQVKRIFSVPQHLWAFLFMACMMFAGFSVIPFISPYAVNNLHMHEQDLKYFYLAGGLATLFTGRMIGWMADKWGKRRMFRVLALASLLPILTLTHLQQASFYSMVVVMVFFMVLVSGRMVPGMALLVSSSPPHLRGSFTSFNASFQQLSTGLAALVAGSLLTSATPTAPLQGYSHVGWLATAATLTCLLLVHKLGDPDIH